jgi:hypothetical protein
MASLSLLLVFLFLSIVVLTTNGQNPTPAPTRSPTIAATKPTVNPTLKPTRKPTYRSKDKSIYMDYAPTKTLTPEQQQGIVATLTVLLFVLMACEVTSPEVLFLIALVICIFTEVLTLAQGLAGFSNTALITIGALFLVVGAIDKSHVVDWMARKTFGSSGSVTFGIFRMFVVCYLLSIFFNNTPLVAILMPVVKDWGRMRGIGASQLLMPLSYAVLAGSFGSMIGTSTNLTVQGLMEADRGFSFPFFAPTPIGMVCFVALLIYMLIAGPYLLPMNKSGLIRAARDSAKSLIAEILVSPTSPAVGKNVESFAASLGVAPSTVIKIRRVKVNPEDEETDPEAGGQQLPVTKSSSTFNVFDKNYLRHAAGFWSTTGTTAKKPRDSFSGARGEPVKTTEEEEPEEKERVAGSNNNITAGSNTGSGGGGGNDDDKYIDIVAPPPHELIGANDIVFLSSAQDAVEKMMKSILGESKGLKVLQSDVLALPGFGSEVLECVISDNNPFLGKKVSEMAAQFAEKYQAALVTVRGREWGNFLSSEEEEEEGAGAEEKKSTEEGDEESGNINERSQHNRRAERINQNDDDDINVIVDRANSGGGEVELTEMRSGKLNNDSEDNLSLNNEDVNVGLVTGKPVLEVPTVSDHIVTLGDVVLCVTTTKNVAALSRNRDFFVVSSVGSLPQPLTWYGLIPCLCFAAMLICVATEIIDICPAALGLSAFFFMGKEKRLLSLFTCLFSIFNPFVSLLLFFRRLDQTRRYSRDGGFATTHVVRRFSFLCHVNDSFGFSRSDCSSDCFRESFPFWRSSVDLCDYFGDYGVDFQ